MGQSPEAAPNRFRHSATKRTPGEAAFGDAGAPPPTATRRRTAGPHVAGAAATAVVTCQRLSGSLPPCRSAWSPTCLFLGVFAAPRLALAGGRCCCPFESAGLKWAGLCWRRGTWHGRLGHGSRITKFELQLKMNSLVCKKKSTQNQLSYNHLFSRLNHHQFDTASLPNVRRVDGSKV